MSAVSVTGDKEGSKSMIHQFLGLPSPFEAQVNSTTTNRSHLSEVKFKEALVK